MRLIISLFILTIINSCATSKHSLFKYMEGTWKIEGREKYEVWRMNNDRNILTGEVYNFKDKDKKVLETLVIRLDGESIVYEATVPDQNAGRTIPFILNTQEESCYSFENMNHDFPNKIQYRIIDNERVEVTVMGKDGKGFSYIQVKQ